jgi:hypothetical protein
LSRSELADKLRVPRSRVTKVLDGETNMTLKTLAQFGLACGVRWLFVGVKADDASAVVTAPAALNLGPGLLWKPLVCVFEPSKQSVLPPLGSPDNAEAEDEREADNQDLSLAA